MMSLVEAKSLLAIDVGANNTRAMLFDAVEGHYRFLAQGMAKTTAGAPVHDISEGVHRAVDQLQSVTGRMLINEDEHLIVPSNPDGSGVDTFVATFSGGPPLRVFMVGLLEDVSLKSAWQLISHIYAQVVGHLTLNDSRKLEEQIDLILRLRPDLVLIAGGTDGGASQSVLEMLDPVGLACYLLPDGQRPDILFVGNQELASDVESIMGQYAPIHLAPNVRPTLDEEQLLPAQGKLVEVFRNIRSRQVQGMQELIAWGGDHIEPTATAFGRVIRFLSKVYDPSKGVLGVDVGGSATSVAAGFAGDLTLKVFPEMGVGHHLPGVLRQSTLDRIQRWIPFETSPDEVRDYIYNKSLYPDSLPATPEELAIDQALGREVLRAALLKTMLDFPAGVSRPSSGQMPLFEPIVAAGNVLSRAPTRAQCMMILLDALQPVGVTTMVLDQNNLSPALGAAASLNPVLVVQVLESGTFINLGTVISPIGTTKPGTPVLHARLTYEDGSEMPPVDVKQGTLEVLPLPVGRTAQLHLQPLQRADIGLGGPGRGGKLRVVGGELGIVIDARGRPLHLPVDQGKRGELMKKWIWTLGG